MGRIGVYYVEYINPWIIISSCILNPAISIAFLFKFQDNVAMFGPWAVITIMVHCFAYIWQMTRPVTNHPNWVRAKFRRHAPERVWKLIFWRQLYKKALQHKCYWWFSYICLLLGYLMFTSIWVLRKVLSDYKDEETYYNLFIVILATSSYLVLASLALDLIIMVMVMVFMVFALFFWFPCIIFCQDWMTWRPEHDGDVDRIRFEDLVSAKSSTQDILMYIFKHK